MFHFISQKKRKVVRKGRNLIPAEESDSQDAKEVVSRFRTLGCSPCTGAIESNADNIDMIVTEAISATRSERENRIIDHGTNTMEDKKKEGYF